MRRYCVAGVLVVGLAFPAWAATEANWFVTVDTVGNCSFTHGKPSAGQTALLETGGYDSMAAAQAALNQIRDNEEKCKGVVE